MICDRIGQKWPYGWVLRNHESTKHDDSTFIEGISTAILWDITLSKPTHILTFPWCGHIYSFILYRSQIMNIINMYFHQYFWYVLSIHVYPNDNENSCWLFLLKLKQETCGMWQVPCDNVRSMKLYDVWNVVMYESHVWNVTCEIQCTICDESYNG